MLLGAAQQLLSARSAVADPNGSRRRARWWARAALRSHGGAGGAARFGCAVRGRGAGEFTRGARRLLAAATALHATTRLRRGERRRAGEEEEEEEEEEEKKGRSRQRLGGRDNEDSRKKKRRPQRWRRQSGCLQWWLVFGGWRCAGSSALSAAAPRGWCHSRSVVIVVGVFVVNVVSVFVVPVYSRVRRRGVSREGARRRRDHHKQPRWLPLAALQRSRRRFVSLGARTHRYRFRRCPGRRGRRL